MFFRFLSRLFCSHKALLFDESATQLNCEGCGKLYLIFYDRTEESKVSEAWSPLLPPSVGGTVPMDDDSAELKKGDLPYP